MLMMNLKVGIAKVEYTPEVGLPLMGNFRDDYGARGVHDPLCSRALVIEDPHGTKVALMSIDICMIDRDNTALMRRHIAVQTGLRPENILIAATHTHSGPAPMSLGLLPKSDDDAVERFLTKAAAAVVLANQRLKPSRLTFGTAQETRLSFNRRLHCKDGKTHMNWEGLDPSFVIEALGPVDPQLATLTVEQDGGPVATLVNFPLHPAILAGDNWLYSADYPGYMAECLSRLSGNDLIPIFFNGCCGDVNHLDYSDRTQGRGFQMTQRVGYLVGVAAFEARNRAVPVEGNSISISHEMVQLKRLRISEEQHRWAQEIIRKAQEQAAPGQVDGLPDEHYARMWAEMYPKQGQDDFAEVCALRIGDLGIVTLPGEMFCKFGLQIKRESPAKHTIVIELANDALGYFPTREAFDQGGYEPSTGTTLYERNAGEKLTASALNQLNQLFSS
ncbi:MAG: neutral/alkaline non-lysosomal ceramidase N-terminal domain-containing protein [Acidobacteriota bacterium]|nr:neutral/alkaline non-lysosomal ceramidase N-terminal domain-containing protein [Acidobacteriota bacterium]